MISFLYQMGVSKKPRLWSKFLMQLASFSFHWNQHLENLEAEFSGSISLSVKG